MLVNRSIGGNYQILDYAVPTSLSKQVKSIMESHSPNADQKQKRLLRTLSRDTRVEKQDGIELLLTRPEVRLMKEAAIAMGTKERIIGSENHPALMFYMTVLRLVKWREQVLGSEDEEENPLRRHRRRWCFWGCDDEDETPTANETPAASGNSCENDEILCDHRDHLDLDEPDCCDPQDHNRCPGDNCDGMCGPSCACWSFICDDCCWYQGCQHHDDCCVEHGYFSWGCLSLWNFSCSSYSC